MGSTQNHLFYPGEDLDLLNRIQSGNNKLNTSIEKLFLSLEIRVKNAHDILKDKENRGEALPEEVALVLHEIKKGLERLVLPMENLASRDPYEPSEELKQKIIDISYLTNKPFSSEDEMLFAIESACEKEAIRFDSYPRRDFVKPRITPIEKIQDVDLRKLMKGSIPLFVERVGRKYRLEIFTNRNEIGSFHAKLWIIGEHGIPSRFKRLQKR